MPLRSHRLENRSRLGLMTSTKLPARNLAMTPRSKWPNIDADRLIAKERRMSENAEATAVASFSPCPTCRQYSNQIGEAPIGSVPCWEDGGQESELSGVDVLRK